jgi:hypothetical protein
MEFEMSPGDCISDKINVKYWAARAAITNCLPREHLLSRKYDVARDVLHLGPLLDVRNAVVICLEDLEGL